MSINPDDPLEGFRGRNHDDAEIDVELRALRNLHEEGIDVELVREVLRSDELMTAMKESRPMARLVTLATRKLDDAAKLWSMQLDPTSAVALNAHREARAARTLIDWIEETITMGAQASKQLEAEEYDDE